MLTLVVGFGLLFIILGLVLNKTEENRPLKDPEALRDKGTIEGCLLTRFLSKDRSIPSMVDCP
jgi:hypothetical protein